MGGDEGALGNGVAAGGEVTPGGALTGGALPGPGNQVIGLPPAEPEAEGGDPDAIGDGLCTGLAPIAAVMVIGRLSAL